MQKIILASASPRRRQLLESIGLPHSVSVSNLLEELPEGLAPAEAAKLLAFQKAAAVAEGLKSGIVIGADTIVVLDGRILGKPRDREDAISMLKALSGNVHQVISGLAVINAARGQKVLVHEETEVTFKVLAEEDILAYVDTGEPLDKAGAYGIQELGGLFVKGIKGCYFNVVGLPLPLLADTLSQFGINVFRIRNSA